MWTLADVVAFDLRPARVDLALYAGDGATLRVRPGDQAVVDGTWIAQVRSSPDSATVDATWTIGDVQDGGAAPDYRDISLDETDTNGLADLGVPVQDASLGLLTRYSGWWDVQSTPAGGSPKTLARGSITVDKDVSR